MWKERDIKRLEFKLANEFFTTALSLLLPPISGKRHPPPSLPSALALPVPTFPTTRPPVQSFLLMRLQGFAQQETPSPLNPQLFAKGSGLVRIGHANEANIVAVLKGVDAMINIIGTAVIDQQEALGKSAGIKLFVCRLSTVVTLKMPPAVLSWPKRSFPHS